MDQRNPVPLSVHHIPICVTFSFFAGGELLLVDPSIIEEQIREGDMTVAMNIHKEICTLSKAGGIPLEMDQIIRCSKIATTKTAEITELIQKALADDKAKRQSK
jgi:exosome complex component RRP45